MPSSGRPIEGEHKEDGPSIKTRTELQKAEREEEEGGKGGQGEGRETGWSERGDGIESAELLELPSAFVEVWRRELHLNDTLSFFPPIQPCRLLQPPGPRSCEAALGTNERVSAVSCYRVVLMLSRALQRSRDHH